MSLPLSLAEYQLSTRKGFKPLSDLAPSEFKDYLIVINNYRTFELYKRISDRYVFARKLLPIEIEDFHFNNGQSFRGATIVERYK